MKTSLVKLSLVLLLAGQSAVAQRLNFAQSDLLSEEEAVGAVRSIRTEVAEIIKQNGKLAEVARRLLRIANFNAQGNRTEVLDFDPEGAVYRKTVYAHDGKGLRTEETEYGQDGLLQLRTVFVPYLLPNSVEARSYDAQGNLQEGKIIYVYGPDGKLLKLIQDGGSSDVVMPYPIWIVLYYADDGRRVEAIHCTGNAKSRNEDMGLPDAANPCGGGKLSGKNFSLYDERGNLTREDVNTANYFAKYEYEFDYKGNWTKRVTLHRRTSEGQTSYEPYSVTYRVFTYY
jgi:hypothetical protein